MFDCFDATESRQSLYSSQICKFLIPVQSGIRNLYVGLFLQPRQKKIIKSRVCVILDMNVRAIKLPSLKNNFIKYISRYCSIPA